MLQSEPTPAPVLTVRTPDGHRLQFSQSFHIGRDEDCEVRIQDVHVSRRHAVVLLADGRWSLRDLQSANGVYGDGSRIEIAPIDQALTVSLGADGPQLTFELEQAEPADESSVLADYTDRYFALGAGEDGEEVGGRTIMIRRAFHQIQRQQRRRYRWVVGAVTTVALVASGYAFYSYRQLRAQRAIAEEMFYAMKSIDVSIAGLQRKLAESGSSGGADLASYLQERRDQEARYEQFAANLSDRSLSEQDRLILRVTRKFGECELAAPSDYLNEVKTYIGKWRSTRRFERAAKQAQAMGYTPRIVDELVSQSLVPQFFYLAMQESDFEPYRSGPPTRWGIAKGMWQFIPETGSRFGLRIGPLAGAAVPDKDDERLHWEKATAAAARYIKEIYATDAQASGLLVIASYNWGERRIIDLLRTMPADPRERNFWKLLERHRQRVPLQTYDYVFSIIAAAVIGENPRLFGFDIDNPLALVDKG
jgi:membrane-bound lytic murein transglycosylase D